MGARFGGFRLLPGFVELFQFKPGFRQTASQIELPAFLFVQLPAMRFDFLFQSGDRGGQHVALQKPRRRFLLQMLDLLGRVEDVALERLFFACVFFQFSRKRIVLDGGLYRRVFLILEPSMTTMIIMMLTTLATMSKKESGFTASVFSLANLGMIIFSRSSIRSRPTVSANRRTVVPRPGPRRRLNGRQYMPRPAMPHVSMCSQTAGYEGLGRGFGAVQGARFLRRSADSGKMTN